MTSFQLKVIALILMIIDHIGNFFPQIKSVLFMRLLGRMVAPIFFYMLVEGFIYTSDRKKYANRLLNFAGIMGVGNSIFYILINTFRIPVRYHINPFMPNIFLSMFLGFMILIEFEKLKSIKFLNYKKSQYISILKILIFIILSIFTEMSEYGLMMIFVFYIFRNKLILKTFSYMIGCILLCFLKGNIIQIFMIYAIFPLLFYNGKKGYSKPFIKYFFYIFYVAHIWILIILSFFIN